LQHGRHAYLFDRGENVWLSAQKLSAIFFLLLGYKFTLFTNKMISQDYKVWKYQGRLHGVYQERVVRILWSVVFSQKYAFSLFNWL